MFGKDCRLALRDSLGKLKMVPISSLAAIPSREISVTRIRSRGPGGQSVNRVASGIHLRFDVMASSLSPLYKKRILCSQDRRISSKGVIIIKTQAHRSSKRNREEAIQNLQKLIQKALIERKRRKPTKPTHASQRRRLDKKRRRSQTKFLRQRIPLV